MPVQAIISVMLLQAGATWQMEFMNILVASAALVVSRILHTSPIVFPNTTAAFIVPCLV